MSKKDDSKGTLVMKFGGTSVGDSDAITKVLEIVQDTKRDWRNLIVVVSAMSGVTNLLLESAEYAVGGNSRHFQNAQEYLRTQHHSVIDELVANQSLRGEVKEEVEQLIQSFGSLCHAIRVLGEASPRVKDAVASLGERLSARVVSGVLLEGGVSAKHIEATQLLITDDCFTAAYPDIESTAKQSREVIIPLFDQGIIPVVTGFIGATPDGVTTTLGRGGSDYSAAILAAVLNAEEVWIWTDVDGVMSADPRIVSGAQTIPVLTYREVGELAYFGAKVLHPKTIRPIVEADIGLRVCNTFNPTHPGTRIVNNGVARKSDSDEVIKAVTAIKGQRLITIEGRGMLGVPGVAARAFGAVATTGTSVILISQASSEQSICFAVPSESSNQIIESLEAVFSNELAQQDIDRIWSTDETVIITVVGAGMQYTPGVAGRVFGALGDKNVNVIAIAQGSSEAAISLVVDETDTETAVRSIHQLIVKS